jgi:hypothetical protein
MSQASTTKRNNPRKDFQVKIVKVDKESILRQAEVFYYIVLCTQGIWKYHERNNYV